MYGMYVVWYVCMYGESTGHKLTHRTLTSLKHINVCCMYVCMYDIRLCMYVCIYCMYVYAVCFYVCMYARMYILFECMYVWS